MIIYDPNIFEYILVATYILFCVQSVILFAFTDNAALKSLTLLGFLLLSTRFLAIVERYRELVSLENNDGETVRDTTADTYIETSETNEDPDVSSPLEVSEKSKFWYRLENSDDSYSFIISNLLFEWKVKDATDVYINWPRIERLRKEIYDDLCVVSFVTSIQWASLIVVITTRLVIAWNGIKETIRRMIVIVEEEHERGVSRGKRLYGT